MSVQTINLVPYTLKGDCYLYWIHKQDHTNYMTERVYWSYYVSRKKN